MWGGILGIIGGIVLIMIIIKLATMNNSNYGSGLDSQLGLIRRGFSGVCAKILRRVGC